MIYKFKCLLIGLAFVMFNTTASMAASSDTSNNKMKSTEYYLAKDLIEKGKFNEAIIILKELEKKLPKDADIFNYLGFSHRKSGNLKLAEKYYDKALKINPKHKGALEYQGEMFLMKGQIIKAKENLKKLDEICFLGCKELDTLNLSIKMKLKGKKSKY